MNKELRINVLQTKNNELGAAVVQLRKELTAAETRVEKAERERDKFLDEIDAHTVDEAIAIYKAALDDVNDTIKDYERVMNERDAAEKRAGRLESAIKSCLDYFNGRESEMGDRCINALTFLKQALAQQAPPKSKKSRIERGWDTEEERDAVKNRIEADAEKTAKRLAGVEAQQAPQPECTEGDE